MTREAIVETFESCRRSNGFHIVVRGNNRIIAKKAVYSSDICCFVCVPRLQVFNTYVNRLNEYEGWVGFTRGSDQSTATFAYLLSGPRGILRVRFRFVLFMVSDWATAKRTCLDMLVTFIRVLSNA